jgi:CBS domain-containing protein
MGEQKVSLLRNSKKRQHFVKSLLEDAQALEYMLKNDWFESDVTRIGAEQEMVMVDMRSLKAAPIALDVLKKLDHDWIETELAKFNLEINLTPRLFQDHCFRQLEEEIVTKLTVINEHLKDHNASIVLTGILPTLRKFDLEENNLTPKKRYRALMKAIQDELIRKSQELKLVGIDELNIKHDTPFIEACNTSFQVHLQVAPANFVRQYNMAQALTAPIMAIASNSPIVFGRRLWHESRIAMFQQALDTRSSHKHLRERQPRVSFGKNWISESILDIYREDIARFRVLLSADKQEKSLDLIANKKVPKLHALQVHNSTIYRWNRPCYGISENGKPHLRIENRVLPAGPSVQDEVANAALWLGAMIGFDSEVKDVRKLLSFADVRDNFIKAAKFGIDSKLNWFKESKYTVIDLLQQEILPLARKGLEKMKVDGGDIDKYLGLIGERCESQMNGSRWSLRAYTRLLNETTRDEALSVLTSRMVKHSNDNLPISQWPQPELQDLEDYEPSNLTVSEFMTTDIFTVARDDIIQLVAEMMDWRNIRYTPVEDKKGKLVGMVSMRLLLRYYIQKHKRIDEDLTTIEDIMIKDPITIPPSATILQAMHVFGANEIGCLPVVLKDELVVIITETDFLRISARLIERLEQKK